ncbi:MAG TPA: outer membrane beta-barrel protein [Puia sp.]|nr:outer membrane beta-barrel protein [Puia sp.]
MFFKLTLPFFLLFFFIEYSCAQNFQLGIKGGLSLPNLTSSGGSDVSKGYKTISGPDFALVLDYKFSEKFSMETSLEWSTQGGQKSGLQTIPASPELTQYFPPGSDAQYLYANFTSMVRLQYLMLPVLLKYKMSIGNSGRWKLYIDGGIFGGLLISAKASAAGSSKVYFDKNETQQVGNVTVQFDSTGDIKNQLRKGNFGIEGNLGLLYQMSSISIFTEGGGNYGFIDLQKNSQNGINHTGALIFRVGILISFKL